ncbi:hypothetical protein [Galactobacter sp.]|uniref:hypothetical protein n=1 Tax=Galactobacter sp. TaxID=2676125 RepID=UPI0025BE969E|nr:hypothetical protein [Galactobacter sp.]
MDQAEAAPGARWRPSGWKDPRLLIGILLILASVIAVAWLVRSSQHTTPMWSAAVDLAVGQEVTGEDLVAVDVRLGKAGDRYLAADAAPQPGTRVLAPIAEGELIPVNGVGRPDPAGRRALAVTVEGERPVGVERGSRVDVYATRAGTVGGEAGTSSVLLSGVEVTTLHTAEATIGATMSTTIEILVPPESVADFIRARGAGQRMDVVALPPGSSE